MAVPRHSPLKDRTWTIKNFSLTGSFGFFSRLGNVRSQDPMTGHLSTLQVKQLCASALPQPELSAAAVHTTECQSCNQRFVEELRRQRGSAPFNFTLEPEFWFRDDHVDFDLLVALADKTLDQETEEIINLHLKTCENCREDVRSFLAFREDTAGELDVSSGPTPHQPTADIPAGPWWQHLQRKPVYAMAAIVLVTVAVLIALIALNDRSDRLEASKQKQTTPRTEGSPNISSSPTPDVVSSPSTTDGSAKITILKDAGGEVTIDKNGHVTGLDQASENSRQYVAKAVLSEQIDAPEVLRRLAGDKSGLRGNDDESPGFRLLYPVRSVVTEDKPICRWQSLPDVSNYRVYLLDADGNKVGQSEELPPTVTQWRAPRLRRGQIYSWAVTAVVDGKKVVSPSASVPEIKFAVLSTADFREINRLKKSRSHLALGVFYARVGLLDQAERELQSLSKLNSESERARKLLESVRSIRKAP